MFFPDPPFEQLRVDKFEPQATQTIRTEANAEIRPLRSGNHFTQLESAAGNPRHPPDRPAHRRLTTAHQVVRMRCQEEA